MKLSKRINFILLPVMLLVFSVAGVFSYNSLKNQIKFSVLEHTEHQINDISNKLYMSFNEVDFFSQLLLDGDNIDNYLNGIRETGEKYYYDKELVNYIKRLNLSAGSLDSFSLINNKTAQVVFYANFVDPFAEFEMNGTMKQHFQYIETQLQEPGIIRLIPKVYKFEAQDNQDKIILVRTFSTNSPITSTSFSNSYELYTAMFVVNTSLTKEYTDILKGELGDDVELTIKSEGAGNTLGSKQDFTLSPIRNQSSQGYELIAPLWKIQLCVSYAYLSERYRPFQFLFGFIVLLVTITTFIILKWLIVSRIINPIVKLTKQVESSDIKHILNLSYQQGNDEVSILTNRYHQLIVELDDLAKRDSLTGLPNRNQFNSDLKRFVESCRKYDKKCAVISFDLDNFKVVNDTYGHHIGDEILKEFAQRLVDSYVELEWNNIELAEFEFARVSGDEFTILLSGFSDLNLLSIFSHQIIALFDGGFEYMDNIYDIGASIGIAVYPDDALDSKTLVSYASLAMFSAKKEQGSLYRFYSSDLDSEAKRNEMIANHLRSAIMNQDFKLVFMPVFDCKTGKICGAETLLRATSEELLTIGPADFIPVAESSGLIKEIDYWVIESSFRTLANWIQDFNFSGVLAINFSSWQLKNQEFVPTVASLLKEYNIPPQQVELEITETCFVPGEYRNTQMLSELHQLGVRLSLDDFGTGFTAFSQLIEYPIDTLKIDRMFISAIDIEKNGSIALVDKMIEIAKLYELNVIAEGVETQAQLEHIKQIGCQQVQGFLLCKPIPEEQFIERWNSFS